MVCSTYGNCGCAYGFYGNGFSCKGKGYDREKSKVKEVVETCIYQLS